MKELDIRIYVYKNASMKKVKTCIPGLRKSIHKCKSIIEAMQYIDIIRKRNLKNLNKQFVFIDFTNVYDNKIVKIY